MKLIALVSEVIDVSSNQIVNESTAELWDKAIFKRVNLVDLISIEIISRLKKTSDVSETVTIGSNDAIPLLKSYVAPKVDNSTVIIEQNINKCDSFFVAKVIKSYVDGIGPDLILCGARTSDYGGGITGAILAGELGISFLGNIINVISVDEKNKTITVKRKMEWGQREILVVPYPIVLGVEAGEVLPTMPTLEQKLNFKLDVIDIDSLISHAHKKLKQYTPEMHRVKPRGVFTPDDTLSPADRIKALMSGGVTNKKRGDILEGGEEGLADQILEYLQEIQAV